MQLQKNIKIETPEVKEPEVLETLQLSQSSPESFNLGEHLVPPDYSNQTETVNLDFNDFDFNNIWNHNGEIPSSPVEIAGNDFFERCGCSVNGNIVTIGEYTYNTENHDFSVNGEVITKAYFSIPTGDVDYSHLNTVTMLTGVDSKGQERKRDVSNISNSIIITFADSDSSKMKISDNVASATKFINQVVGTDLSGCQNIITGGSRFGARSLKIAAATGDLYQTVICVNNAILVKGENSSGGGKEFFASTSELEKLDGKSIYFISAKKDDNLTMLYKNGSEFARTGDVTQGYVYTGINLAIEHCPNAMIYFISNNTDPAFASISAPNYQYRPDLWSKVAKSSDYSDHGSLHNILNDLCSSSLIGYNEYSEEG